jgi:ubiquinone/menaquinone biosynthesis C-methylase UbiE
MVEEFREDHRHRESGRKMAAGGKGLDAYAHVAWFYNLWGRLTESKTAGVVMEFAGVRGEERILEVAVGTGAVFENLVRQNRNGVAEGIDISASMLKRAVERMKSYPPERYRLQTGSAYRIPFPPDTFDLLVNNFMLDLCPEEDFSTILSEFYRVIKPGGRMVLATMAYGERWYNSLWPWIARHFPRLLTGCKPVSVRGYAAQAGFENIDSVSVSQNTFPSQVLRATKPSAVCSAPPSGKGFSSNERGSSSSGSR